MSKHHSFKSGKERKIYSRTNYKYKSISSNIKSNHSFYPLGCRGDGDFRKFSIRGGWEILGPQGGAALLGGAPKSRGGLKIMINFVRM